MGFVGIYSLGVPENEREVFRLAELTKWSRTPANPADELVRCDVPISDVAISSDASQVYVGNDVGQLIVLDTEQLAVKREDIVVP